MSIILKYFEVTPSLNHGILLMVAISRSNGVSERLANGCNDRLQF